MASSSTSTDGPVELPSGRALGTVEPPPSKSITNRLLALAFLSGRETVIERPLCAGDTERFRMALQRAGWRCEGALDAWRLEPPRRTPTGTIDIDCGASGTMLRFLTAACAARPGRYRLDGSARLRERPLGPLIDALRGLGAGIECLGKAGFAPLQVEGATLRGGAARLDAGRSSQFVSALLLAGQRAVEPIELTVDDLVSAPYVALTVRLIRDWGGSVECPTAGTFRIRPGAVGAARLRVEADASAACYAAAAAALPGGRVEVRGLKEDTAQGDARFFDLLATMGAAVSRRADAFTVAARELRGLDVDLSAMPDQVPTLAALAPYARGQTVIRNVPHVRLKESDRLAAMASLLTVAGAEVRQRSDGLVIQGTWHGRSAPSNPVVLDPFDDHRIAMSAAVLGVGRARLRLRHPDVVAKSYPDFWQDWRQIMQA